MCLKHPRQRPVHTGALRFEKLQHLLRHVLRVRMASAFHSAHHHPSVHAGGVFLRLCILCSDRKLKAPLRVTQIEP